MHFLAGHVWATVSGLKLSFLYPMPLSLSVGRSVVLWWGCHQYSWLHTFGHLIHCIAGCLVLECDALNAFLQVLDIHPAIAWDKGKAVDCLLSSPGEYNCSRNLTKQQTHIHTRLAMSSAWILIQIRKLVVVDMAGLSDCRDVFPVYIGDDRIDEDAFKVRGNLLYTVSSISVAMCIYLTLVIMSTFSLMRVGSLLCAFINLSGLCSKLVLVWMSL